jgi:alanine racemase
MTESLRCWSEIDIDAMRFNLGILRSLVAAGVRMIAVTKADAYGHGLPEIACRLDNSVDLFGVASHAEGRTIRAAGAQAPVLILGPALPGERASIVEESFIPSVSTIDEARAFAKCVRSDAQLPVHFVIDTGMGRIGSSEQEAADTFRAILATPQLRVAAISTHLPVADEDEGYTREQLNRFRALTGRFCKDEKPSAVLNSAGVIRFGQIAMPGDFVRVGLALYGISPIAEFQARLKPAMTLKTRVILVRWLGPSRSISYGRTFVTRERMKVATLSAGYGDGVDRHLSGQETDVLIHGRRCRLLGRVTMDQIMVDVTGLERVEPGDEAVLFGRQGSSEILASEVASKAGTIAWEVFTGITKRVPRIYL